MNDNAIIQLYFAREQAAIDASEKTYGGLCRSIARRILRDARDVEECISDLWLRVWNAIPPTRPDSLRAYLARVVRNLALDRAGYNGAARRKSALEESFEELAPCLCISDSAQSTLEEEELRAFLRDFLLAQPQKARVLFVRRYWYGESIRELAGAFGSREDTIRSSLFRTRTKLRAAMQKEGICL